MKNKVKFIMCLHSHQPVGNFHSVFEDVYIKSYLPFLKVFKEYPDFKLSLHYSGPLLEWLEMNKPEYFEILNSMIKIGQVEIVGGAFYEPILTLLPSNDRIDQIQTMNKYIKMHFNKDSEGFWLAERVWEQSLVYDLADAGVSYTMVDHTHFNYGGFKGIPTGFYRSEDRGRSIFLFPINEKLRYLIPFSTPDESIDYLRKFLNEDRDRSIVVYGDDGEKFGSWPGTYDLIYKEEWLRKFIETVLSHNDWLETTSFSRVLDEHCDSGLAYLPDASYREMMEWALYPDQQQELDEFYKTIEDCPEKASFVRGGSYRNFRKKYHESFLMYCRMLSLSSRVKNKIQKEFLHKSQCNCAYWHGVFGGIYMPHLRNAVFENIIEAENLLDTDVKRIESQDIDLDGYDEYILNLENQKLIIDSDCGGRIISWDLNHVPTNFQSTFTRQKEHYHRYIFEGNCNEEMAGVHDVPRLKEDDLEEYLIYDTYQRYSLIEHELNTLPSSEDIHKLNFSINKKFIERKCVGREKKNMLHLINKQYSLEKLIDINEEHLKVSYHYSKKPDSKYLAVEWNLFTMSPDAPDKWLSVNGDFSGNPGVFAEKKGNLLEYYDEFRGFKVGFHLSTSCEIRISPVYTVNLSESGIEKVFQNTTLFFITEVPLEKSFEIDVHVEKI